MRHLLLAVEGIRQIVGNAGGLEANYRTELENFRNTYGERVIVLMIQNYNANRPQHYRELRAELL